MNKADRHFTHYLVLIVGLSLVLFLLFIFKYDYTAKVVISFGGSLFYSTWGIIHHAAEKRLSKLIAVEYALFGLFAFLLLITAISI